MKYINISNFVSRSFRRATVSRPDNAMERKALTVPLAVLGINAFARATLLSRGIFVSTTLADSVIGGAEASSSSESGSGSGTGVRESGSSFGDATRAGGGVCGGAAGT